MQKQLKKNIWKQEIPMKPLPQIVRVEMWKNCDQCGKSYGNHQVTSWSQGWIQLYCGNDCCGFKHSGWNLNKDGKSMHWKCRQCGIILDNEYHANHRCDKVRYGKQDIEKWRHIKKIDYQMKQLYDKARQDKKRIEKAEHL